MGLKYYVHEAQARSSQASQLNSQAGQAIASLQQSIHSFLSAPLSSKAYDSAKSYFMVVYTPLCQSAIMTGEAMEAAHKRFLSEYQGSVSGIDTDEDLILEEINQLEQLKRSLDQQMSTAKTPRPDLERRYMNACDVIEKRRDKLEKFHAYNALSASIFSECEACQQEFDNGLAQVKECKAWNPATGTFDIYDLGKTDQQSLESTRKNEARSENERS
ncbi:T7SS effector LXG polymorphic toxin [Enterococcus faecalis]